MYSDAYLSTSAPGGQYSAGSVKVEVKIKAKPGSMNSGKMDHLSEFSGEKEVIFKPGTPFKIMNVKKGTGGKPHSITIEEQ